MRSWPCRLWYRCNSVQKRFLCVDGRLINLKPYICCVQKLMSNTTLPQVSPWLDGVYWISLERDSPLFRNYFRKRVNSLAWSLLRARKSVMQGKLNRAKKEGFIFPLMTHSAALAIPEVILGTWTWEGWHTRVSGLSLTSNDYNILESDRRNPKRPHHYGQKKWERKWSKRKYTSAQRNYRKPCGYTERSPPSLQSIYFSLTEICQCLTTTLSSTSSCEMEAQHV